MKNLKNTSQFLIKRLMIVGFCVLTFASLATPAKAAPVTTGGSSTGGTSSASSSSSSDNCKYTTVNNMVNQNAVNNCLTQSPIVSRIQQIVDFLSAGVGIIVVGVILVGGIQYTIAGDSPQALKSARDRIVNGLIALFAFLFIFAFLQWLIPGGIFK